MRQRDSETPLKVSRPQYPAVWATPTEPERVVGRGGRAPATRQIQLALCGHLFVRSALLSLPSRFCPPEVPRAGHWAIRLE
jgi:hypothetical protein